MSASQFVVAAMAGLVASESTELLSWLATRLMAWATRHLYRDTRRASVRPEELQALLADVPTKLFKLATATGFATFAIGVLVGRGSQRLATAGPHILAVRSKARFMAYKNELFDEGPASGLLSLIGLFGGSGVFGLLAGDFVGGGVIGFAVGSAIGVLFFTGTLVGSLLLRRCDGAGGTAALVGLLASVIVGTAGTAAGIAVGFGIGGDRGGFVGGGAGCAVGFVVTFIVSEVLASHNRAVVEPTGADE